MQISVEMTHVKTGKAGNSTATMPMPQIIFKHQVGSDILITDYIYI